MCVLMRAPPRQAAADPFYNFSVTMSYVQIYRETINDLLLPESENLVGAWECMGPDGGAGTQCSSMACVCGAWPWKLRYLVFEHGHTCTMGVVHGLHSGLGAGPWCPPNCSPMQLAWSAQGRMVARHKLVAYNPNFFRILNLSHTVACRPSVRMQTMGFLLQGCMKWGWQHWKRCGSIFPLIYASCEKNLSPLH